MLPIIGLSGKKLEEEYFLTLTIFVPLFLPLVQTFGIDLIHFGVMAMPQFLLFLQHSVYLFDVWHKFL